jgi:hypothetical protein
MMEDMENIIRLDIVQFGFCITCPNIKTVYEMYGPEPHSGVSDAESTVEGGGGGGQPRKETR